jgi:hypothetical protein
MKSYDELKAEMEAIQQQMVEAKKRFELSTFSLATICSTTELRPLILPFIQPLVQHYLIQKLCQYAHFCLPQIK